MRPRSRAAAFLPALTLLGLAALAGCGNSSGTATPSYDDSDLARILGSTAPGAPTSSTTPRPPKAEHSSSTPSATPSTTPSTPAATTSTPAPDPDALTLEPDVAGWTHADDGSIVRIDVQNAGRTAEVSLSDDGTVLLVADLSVAATPSDFTSWRLDAAGLSQALRDLDALGVRDRDAGGFTDQGATGSARVSIFLDAGARSISSGEGTPGFLQVATLVKRLANPDTYAAHRKVPAGPWTPAEIDLPLVPATGATLPERTWPVSRTVAQLGKATALPRGQGYLVCLTGGDAARLWGSLGTDAIRSYRWTDADRTYAGPVDVVRPGYRLDLEGC